LATSAWLLLSFWPWDEAFPTREDMIAEMEEYLKQLQAETKGVEEHLADLKKTQAKNLRTTVVEFGVSSPKKRLLEEGFFDRLHAKEESNLWIMDLP
jgi:hypothetical protein